MHQRAIGDLKVGAVGLGAMPLSVEGRPDEDRAVATVHAALDAGVTLIDTADAYCLDGSEMGHNESLVARALASYGSDTSHVLVATKGGHTRPADGSWRLDGSARHLREACQASLRRLGVDAIGLYQFHRPDPEVPWEESVGALRDLVDEGLVVRAGVSNADPDQIRQAREILGGRLASVQNQFSPDFRSSEPELRLCEELGVAFLPWSPLGGIRAAAELGSRARVFQEVAEEVDATAQQVALAWELALSPVVVPIPGSSRPETVVASAAAADLTLSQDQLHRLGAA
jgi:aryl-alcohol dehydrogenase-like predicted oxidoreductase